LTTNTSKVSEVPADEIGTDRFIMTVRCADGIGVIATVAKALAD
jgi:hypothetical protein